MIGDENHFKTRVEVNGQVVGLLTGFSVRASVEKTVPEIHTSFPNTFKATEYKDLLLQAFPWAKVELQPLGDK